MWSKGVQYLDASLASPFNSEPPCFQVLLFQMDSPKLILDPTDAAKTIELAEDDEDDLNEVNKFIDCAARGVIS